LHSLKRNIMKILIKNIKQLVQVEQHPKLKVAGKEMSALSIIEDAWLAIDNGLIADFGSMQDWPGITDWTDLNVIDASGKLVFPSWCDSHTHIVYAGSRELEFVSRIKGLTYEEIAKQGGGILNSAKRLQQTSEDELAESALKRLNEIMHFGTGAVEIKSGYGLTVEDEIKMLRVIKKIKNKTPLTIKSTFLGAHAMPLEYKNNRKGYVDLIINKMLPQIAEEKLADYCDVFCDKGFYTPEETDSILRAGLKYGLRPKIHANELDYSGGIQVGVQNNALSVDHLEFTGDEEIAVLLKSQTMPTLLPSTAFFLNLHYPPARKMIDSGLPVALATDYNPGSSPSGKMSFVLSLACVQMKMLPEEAINAATINSAYAMDLSKELGSIAIGKKANVFVTSEIPSYSFLPYSFGSNLVETVILNGKIIE
jgi:imidazolonepropionase